LRRFSFLSLCPLISTNTFICYQETSPRLLRHLHNNLHFCQSKKRKRYIVFLCFDTQFSSLTLYQFCWWSTFYNHPQQGSKRASSSIAEKPPKKPKKDIIDLTETDQQVYSFPWSWQSCC
jgi:hypothetical protein